MLKTAEKAKAQKIVDKIQSGNFDENDVDNLFMRLRAYSGEHWVFREVADFVAHNDARNKGLTNASLEAFHLTLKFYTDYSYQQKPLDVSLPIPLYIKKLMKYQVDKCDPEQLRREFNVAPERLKSRIDNYFKDDKKNKTTELQRHKVGGPESFAPIQHLLGFIGSVPAFTADSLVQDLVGVLKSNRLVFDEHAISKQRSTVILCVMLLMHQTSFEFSDDAKGECRIALEHPNTSEFGELQVMGTVSVTMPDGAVVSWGFPVFISGLQAVDYCDDSLFRNHAFSADSHERALIIDLNRELFLLEGNRLGPLVGE
jgi:hypothetical protein